MRILVVADGSSSHVERFVAELRGQGAEVWLASLQRGEGVDIILARRSSIEWLNYFLLSDGIQAQIEELKPDVVNAHFASAYGYSAARCRRKYGSQGVGWALSVWGSDILVSPQKSVIHKARVRKALRGADITLADSTYLAEQARSLEDCETCIIPWGVEKSILMDDEGLRAKAKWTNGPLRLLAPRPHKTPYNNEELISSLAPELRSGGATLLTTQEGDVTGFARACKAQGVTHAVKYYGRLSRADYLNQLSEQDVLLSASRSDSSPVSVIEALAVGTLPLVADIPGLEDILPEQISQFCLFGLGDPNDLCGKLRALREMDHEKRFTILKAGRDHIAKVALYENNISGTLAVFQRLLESRV